MRGFKISGIHAGYSHFSPFWLKTFIKEKGIKSAYDPCGGWGHRLLGGLNVEYIYNDIWDKSVNGIRDMIEYFNLTNTLTYNKDCTRFTPPDKYECVFTCPPYYNVERYGADQFSSQKQFSGWIDEMLTWSVKPGVKYVGIVINGRYESIVRRSLSKLTSNISDRPLGKNYNHFTYTHKANREVLLIATV